MIPETVHENVEQVFGHFPRYHMKILLGDFGKMWRKGIFSNRQLGMKVCIRIVMMRPLEESTLPHQEIYMIRRGK